MPGNQNHGMLNPGHRHKGDRNAEKAIGIGNPGS
jgi:hypothetical protein